MDEENFDEIYQRLTYIQRKVIPFLLQGLSYKEIAAKLNITDPNTITKRVSSIRQLFNASDKKDLIYIFNKFRPEWVTDEGRKHAGIAISPITPEIVYPESSEAIDSPFYVLREKIDIKCQNIIDESGCLLKIKAPKQMGKTSLINRLFDYAIQKENYVASCDFSDVFVDSNNTDKFFYNLSACIAREISNYTERDLNLSSWNQANASPGECTRFLKKVLKALDKPLVLIFDDTDRIFQYESVYQCFAPILRSWHENGRRPSHGGSSDWKKLKIVLSHSTEEYVELNIDRSPFGNVGITIELEDLTHTEIFELADRHNINDERFITSLMNLVGGHPYLIRLAFYYLSQEDLSPKKILEEAATDSGIYREHLKRHLARLQKNSALEEALKRILISKQPISIREQKIKHQLEGIGLITLQRNSATVRYELYRKYFTDYLL